MRTSRSPESGDPEPRLSRALLLPGALPPSTHLGVTLLRHVVVTGLRYALHQLGLEMLERPPVRIVSLRLYLDAAALRAALGDGPAGEAVRGALVDPGGSDGLSGRLRGAVLFHGLRLRRRRLPAAGPEPREEHPAALWAGFRGALSRVLWPLNEAVLAELCAALLRRRDRRRGVARPPCLGTEAARLRRGRRARLELLGPAEPLYGSWATTPERAAEARAALAAEPVPPAHPLRGRFREVYRGALDVLAPRYRRLAEDAAARGLLEAPDDAFFLPLDVAEDLTAERRPGWLPGAVAANRREYLAARAAPAPPELLGADRSPAAAAGDPRLAPLAPLS